MARLERKHLRAIRWMHWFNVPLLFGMIWSGLLIYWANDIYRIGLGNWTLLHLFPEWVYATLRLDHRLAEGMAWHFAIMWLLATNGLCYVSYTLLSGEWRHLVPNRSSIREAWMVILHDLHLSSVEPPKRKFNGAQQFAYTGVVLMGAASLLTGLAIYKPTQVAWLTSLLGGYPWARWEHFWLTMGYLAFFVIHISQVIRAGWNNFRAMVTGYEVTATHEAHYMGSGAPIQNRPAPVNPIDVEIRGLTRRSFASGAIAALAGASGIGWLATRQRDDGIPWPLRRILEFNEEIAESAFGARRLAPEFSAAAVAAEPRVNGLVGLMSLAVLEDWTIDIVGKVERHIPLVAIKQLPAYGMTTEFKCVEGWSRIVSWKGARLADVLDKYGAPSHFVGLSTPLDGRTPTGLPDRYYVGFDRPSAGHPQTLLCYEMNGAPLTQEHGAPLRLVSTVKYGYKCIKRISVIKLADRRPADFWAQRGYDWYAGH